jgi:hypothetical protein
LGQTSETTAFKYPYLLHLETVTFYDQSCVLLKSDGQFHLELEKGDRARVFEGALPEDELVQVQKLINNDRLRNLTQNQIVEPSVNVQLDELHIDVFRGDHWQDLFFLDAPSRRPFENFIAPLVRWLDALHKEPHREVSEDEGKNDCQLPKRIVLKRRRPPATKNVSP